MNSLEVTSAVTALANTIACQLTTDEIILLASILVQLGDTLVTLATWNDLCEKSADSLECNGIEK